MSLTKHRLTAILTATLAALSLAAAPAMAGENDDGDDDESGTMQPAPSGGGSTGSAPVGGVATGAGGTVEQGPDAVLLGLASGALMLVATGGGLVAVSRRGR